MSDDDLAGLSPYQQRIRILTANVCGAPYVWLGVCDEHEQHWTGWIRSEVEALGAAHLEFWLSRAADARWDSEDDDEELDDEEDEEDAGCAIYYVERA